MMDTEFGGMRFLRMLRNAVETEAPTDLLYFASMVAHASTTGDDNLGPSGKLSSELRKMIKVLLAQAQPETDVLLLVWAQILGDRLLRDAVDDLVKPRVQVVPPWLAELTRMRPVRAVSIRSVLGEEETVLLEAAGPRGGFLMLVQFDLLATPYIEEAYPLDDKIDVLLEAFSTFNPAEVVIQDMDLANLRARVEDALWMNARMYPPIQTDTWPSSQPLLEWLMRQLPDGGPGFEGRLASEESVDDLARRFITSAYTEGIRNEAENLTPVLLDLAVNYGTGDPRQWGSLLIERILLDLVPRKVLYRPEELQALPDVLDALVCFTHSELGIDPEVTAKTRAVIVKLTPQYLDLIAGGGTGNAQMLRQMGFTAELIDSALEAGPDALEDLLAAALNNGAPDFSHVPLTIVDHLAAEVGGADKLDGLDLSPLPADEPLDVTGVPDDILGRVQTIAGFIEQAATGFFGDPEMGAAALRTLARLASTGPELFRRRSKDSNSAGAVCWITAQNNQWFDRANPERTVKALIQFLGLKASPRERAETMLATLNPSYNQAVGWADVTLGDPQLLTSTRRKEIVDVWRSLEE